MSAAVRSAMPAGRRHRKPGPIGVLASVIAMVIAASGARHDADAEQTPWWKRAVVYQIYPRSFADSGGDGVGDLAGIRAHLPDLAWLGVDVLWLSPFFPSPMVDFGYDVSDYCNVDPLFGSLDEFDALLADAHALGMRVIIDWVPNHTSERHPWFVDARSGLGSGHRSWYVWRDGVAGQPPNNWVAAFDPSKPAWSIDESSGQWYLHLFDPAQPDLNWDEPGVVKAMHDVLRFWLDRGVDGFRADVIHCIGKDPALPDDPHDSAGIPHSALNDVDITHQRLRQIRTLLDGYPGHPFVVGEVYLLSTEQVATYYGDGDELHLAFNFPPLFAAWQAASWRRCITDTVAAFCPRCAWPSWVLSNHDNPRHRSRYDAAGARHGETPSVTAARSEARARCAAVLLLTLRGTPFLYQGEELGLLDAAIPAERSLDPGGRDGCRAPFPWSGTSDRGWPVPDGVRPWLPFPPEEERNYQSLRDEPTSILHLYRRLLEFRCNSLALTDGDMDLLECPEGVLAYRRERGTEVVVILINFTDRTIALDPVALGITGGSVALSSNDAESGQPIPEGIRPDQALVVLPVGGPCPDNAGGAQRPPRLTHYSLRMDMPPIRRARFLSSLRAPAIILAGITAFAALLPVAAGAATNATSTVISAAYAKHAGFPTTVIAARSSSHTQEKNCPVSAEAAYSNASTNAGLVSETLTCKTTAAATQAFRQAKTTAKAEAHLKLPKVLGKAAFLTAAQSPQYSLIWHHGSKVGVTAIDTNVSASASPSSAAAKPAPVAITAAQTKTLIAAAVSQNRLFGK